MRIHRPSFLTAAAVAALALTASPALAQVPSTSELLNVSGSDADKAKAGEFVEIPVAPSNERERTSGLLFPVEDRAPSDTVKRGRHGLLDRRDPNTVPFELVEGDPTPADLAHFSWDRVPPSRPRASWAQSPVAS